MNPWLGIGAVLLALGGMLIALRLGGRTLPAEMSRKAAHVIMGLVCLGLPWIFAENWPVLLLAGLAVAGLGAVRGIPFFKKRLGSVLGGVARESWGEIYFPVAVAAVFVLSGGDKLLFCVPILMLTLADSAGALIGAGYGHLRYETPDGTRKSWEGSVAFFSVAFLSAHIPVLLFSEVGRAASLLIAFLLAGIVMLAEAASWRGLDNLFVPLSAQVLLKDYLLLDTTALGQRALMLLVVFALALWLRRRTTLNGGALALGIILCYTCGAIGGWNWLLAPLAVFLGYSVPFLRRGASAQRRHSIEGVLCVASGALFWTLASAESGRADLVYPFTVWLSTNFAIIATAQMGYDFPQRPLWKIIPLSIAWPLALCLIPFMALTAPESGWAWVFALLAVPLIALAALLFNWLEPNPREARVTFPRWIIQGAVSFAASVAAWLLLGIPLLFQ